MIIVCLGALFFHSSVPTDFALEQGTLDPRLDFTVGRRDIDMNGWGVNVGKDWRAIAFSGDNQLLALVKKKEVAVWRMTTGKRVLHLQRA